MAIPVDMTQCGCVAAGEAGAEREGTQISGIPTVPEGDRFYSGTLLNKMCRGVLHINFYILSNT